MTDSMIAYSAAKWTLNYPDSSMASGTTYAGKSMQEKGSTVYAMFSSSSSIYNWLPSICPDGKYQGSTPSVTANGGDIRTGTITYAEWWTTSGEAEIAAWVTSRTQTTTAPTTAKAKGAVFLRWKTISSLMIVLAIF